MDALSSSIPTSTEIYAMKQAMRIQEQAVSKLLESLPTPQSTESSHISGLASEGIGSNLDLKA